MLKAAYCECREREELEKAEHEGREIQEEEPNDENMQNPFQPISSVISVVCEIVIFGAKFEAYFIEPSSTWSFVCPLFQYENKELEMQRQTALQETTSIKTDAVQEEEDDGKDDEPDNKKQTPDNSSSGEHRFIVGMHHYIRSTSVSAHMHVIGLLEDEVPFNDTSSLC